MRNSLSEYKTFVFDCDGVILNSNKIKTEAFYQTAVAYSEEAAEALVDYHIKNGGISRYKKFAYLLNEIVPTLASKISRPNLEALLENYATIVLDGLLTCEAAEGLEKLRNKTHNVNWLIVSGGDQAELRHVFNVRELGQYFDGGIFGSPNTKDEILEREISIGNIQYPALFLGDSKYDYQASNTAGLDFIFLTGWSEVAGWEEWCQINQIAHYGSLKQVHRSY